MKKNQEEFKLNKDKKLIDEIKFIKKELESFEIKPNFNDEIKSTENLKNLNKQLDQIKIKNIINDKTKNIINDKKVADFTFRFQTVQDLPSKELRTIVDAGKKEIKKGILIVFSIFEGKVGVSVGITNDLTDKFNAVDLVKEAASILEGKGGGGRKDFAQAGGVNQKKIDDAYKVVLKIIS
ncbi:DHHA1 domain-containing protein [Pelagibacteraceae bacterium]|nr:DHHA1 domain-containing protein [Pelagibacteraceae bacterium]